jgi:hypothetical protein
LKSLEHLLESYQTHKVPKTKIWQAKTGPDLKTAVELANICKDEFIP